MKTERLSVVFGDPGTRECDSAAAELQCLRAHPDPRRLGGIASRTGLRFEPVKSVGLYRPPASLPISPWSCGEVWCFGSTSLLIVNVLSAVIASDFERVRESVQYAAGRQHKGKPPAGIADARSRLSAARSPARMSLGGLNSIPGRRDSWHLVASLTGGYA